MLDHPIKRFMQWLNPRKGKDIQHSLLERLSWEGGSIQLPNGNYEDVFDFTVDETVDNYSPPQVENALSTLKNNFSIPAQYETLPLSKIIRIRGEDNINEFKMVCHMASSKAWVMNSSDETVGLLLLGATDTDINFARNLLTEWGIKNWRGHSDENRKVIKISGNDTETLCARLPSLLKTFRSYTGWLRNLLRTNPIVPSSP